MRNNVHRVDDNLAFEAIGADADAAEAAVGALEERGSDRDCFARFEFATDVEDACTRNTKPLDGFDDCYIRVKIGRSGYVSTDAGVRRRFNSLGANGAGDVATGRDQLSELAKVGVPACIEVDVGEGRRKPSDA